MSIPGFQADVTVYRSTGRYRGLYNGYSQLRSAEFTPQQNLEIQPLRYACTSAACACAGSADCAACVQSGTCHGSFSCGGGPGAEVCIFGPH
jgi:hypothetical protein